MVRDNHASFVRQPMIANFGCCKAVRKENEELRDLLSQEKRKFKRLSALYHQLLASFSAQSSPSEMPITTIQSPPPNRVDDISQCRNEPCRTIAGLHCSPPVTEKSKPAFVREETGSFYFVDGNGVVGNPSINLPRSVQRMRAQFVRNCEERQKQVREASRRRAIFAAHRRAAACDVLRGNVEFDDVNELLMADLTKIQAFPRNQMAKETIRRMHHSSHSTQQRQKQTVQVEKAINNVLSFCFSQRSMGRILWVVRHAEREDNVNRRWRERSDLRPDNSPLSKRGCTQAQELAKRFENVALDHVFTSPFDRTVDTVTRLIGGRGINVNVEPGLCEALYLCERPPGFEAIEKIKAKYPLVDASYEPVVGFKMPKEGYGDDACVPRLRTTLSGILERCKTGSILLMAHGASVGAIHEVLMGDFKYVGQATVTKFIEQSPGKFQLEFSGDSSHLSDRSNLRPW